MRGPYTGGSMGEGWGAMSMRTRLMTAEELSEADILTGDALMPGFSCRVGGFFPK